MKLKIFDTNGLELNIGSFVEIQHSGNNDGLTFYTSVQVIEGQLYPFNKFRHDRILKINEIPSDCIHCLAKGNLPEYWIKRNVELKLIEEKRLEKWKIDSLSFERNSFYEVSI